MARFAGLIAVTILAIFSSGQLTESRATSATVEDVAGFFMYRILGGRVEYILLKKAGENDWSPPKGRVEEGETDQFETAFREVFEETQLLREDYQAYSEYKIYFEYTTNDNILKRVSLWPARLLNLEKPIIISEEHDDFDWLAYNSAITTIKDQYADALREGDNIIRAIEAHTC